MKRRINDLVLKPWWSTGEIAYLFGVNPNTVLKWIGLQSDPLRVSRLPRRNQTKELGWRRIAREHLLAFMRAHNMSFLFLEDSTCPRIVCVHGGSETKKNVLENFPTGSFSVRFAQSVFSAGGVVEAFLPALVILDFDFCHDADRVCIEIKESATKPIVIGIGRDHSILHGNADAFIDKASLKEMLSADTARLLEKRYQRKRGRVVLSMRGRE